MWIQKGIPCGFEVPKVVRFYSHFLGASVSKTKQAPGGSGFGAWWVEQLEISLIGVFGRSSGYDWIYTYIYIYTYISYNDIYIYIHIHII